jgi:hypothetical protein
MSVRSSSGSFGFRAASTASAVTAGGNSTSISSSAYSPDPLLELIPAVSDPQHALAHLTTLCSPVAEPVPRLSGC